VTLSNPLDINPAADDHAHARICEILADDPNVDAVILSLDPMSPAMKTLDGSATPGFDMHRNDSIRQLIIDLNARIRTPVVTVVDGGRLYDPLRDALMAEGVPVFQVCDQAVAALALYIQGRLRSDAIRSDAGWTDMKKEEA
jgi:acyl-CoA synthetase (NDP forming)